MANLACGKLAPVCNRYALLVDFAIDFCKSCRYTAHVSNGARQAEGKFFDCGCSEVLG